MRAGAAGSEVRVHASARCDSRRCGARRQAAGGAGAWDEMPPHSRMAAVCPHQLSRGAEESVDYARHKGAVQTKGVGQASQVGVGHALRRWDGSAMVELTAGAGKGCAAAGAE